MSFSFLYMDVNIFEDVTVFPLHGVAVSYFSGQPVVLS